MTNHKIRSQWLIRWIAASTMSWMFAALFGEVCRNLARQSLSNNIGWSIFIAAITMLGFGVIATSLTQGNILRSASNEIGGWERATWQGWLSGIGVGIPIFVVSALLLAKTLSLLMPAPGGGSSLGASVLFAILALPIAAVLGGLGILYFMGSFQAKILNQLIEQNTHWVRTSIISGVAGSLVVICAFLILRRLASPMMVFAILGAIYGMLTGAITGMRLTSLLSLRVDKEESVEI